jgi:cell division protein ZapA (FtsZ GTPase activity inhibitor)
MSETSLEQEQKYARQQVDRFVRRFEPSYKKLAYYAALPLVLTPELLNYLRNQLLWKEGENIPWVAEVDLLLSDICRPVGYEQYAMEPAVRAYLISEMEEVLGKKQIEAVARLLITYIKHLSQTNPYISSQELETQQWAAMVCIDDKRQEAVGQISQAYRKCIEATEGRGNPLLNRAEMERLSRITQELAPQLRDYPTLLAFAEVVRRLDADPTKVSDELLNRSWRVADVELRLPNAPVPSQEDTSSSTSQLPNRRTFKFEEAIIVFEDEIDLQSFEFEVATLNRDIIGFINELVFARKKYYLNDIQIQVLTQALNKQTYQEIAETLAYSSSHIKEIASELWKLLSEIFNTKVTKTNLKSLFVNGELVIHRTRLQALGYSEDLGNGVQLEMVAIPEGSFVMGSPEGEEGHSESESPQH